MTVPAAATNSTSSASKAFNALKAPEASKVSDASDTLKQKVLIITYYWPPGSGAGVQRWLKFSRYLPEYGWEPVILTVAPEYATYPATDATLESDIPPGLEVHRTKATDWFRFYRKDKRGIPSAGFASGIEKGPLSKISRFVRGNFFIPDPRKGWNRFAFRKACRLIEEGSVRYLITTSPPHSTQLIGLKLKRKYPSVKWIADLRDPWTDIYYYDLFYPSPVARAIDRRFEKMVLQKADRIITVGPSLKKLLSAKTAGVDEKTMVITNGFDEEDFRGVIARPPEAYTISYIGTLSENYPLKGFLNALKIFRSCYNGKIVLRFVGSVAPFQKNILKSDSEGVVVEFMPHADHLSAIKFMSEATLLLLIIPEHATSRSIITGKLYEYIAAGRPVLCIGPEDGDASEIISASSAGVTCGYEESLLMSEFLSGAGSFKTPPPEKILPYSRKHLSKRLSDFLNS